MPIRFRKSFRLFPGVKVNVSKGGTSITVGKKGFHLNFSKRGVRQTVGLPGSGISETSYLAKSNSEDSDEKESKKEVRSSDAEDKPRSRAKRTTKEGRSSPWGFLLFVLIALFFFYFGANAFGLLPPKLITNFLQTLTQWASQVGL